MSISGPNGQAGERARRTPESIPGADEVVIALRAPVSREKMEGWVEEEVDRLREAAWSSRVRLGPLWPGWRSHGADWLIEVDLRDRNVELDDDVALASVLIKMELLGLRPQLLVSSPRESPRPARVAAPTAQAPARRGSE